MKDALGRKVDIKDVETPAKQQINKFKYFIKAGWIFNTWYEKIILIIITYWAIYSFIKYILL